MPAVKVSENRFCLVTFVNVFSVAHLPTHFSAVIDNDPILKT